VADRPVLYDLIVIGGGAAGQAAAAAAAKSGLSTLIFEAGTLGGASLSRGGAAALRMLSETVSRPLAVANAGYADVGWESARLSPAEIFSEKDRRTASLVAEAAQELGMHGVRALHSKAVITGQKYGLFAVESDGVHFFSRRLFLAPGSDPILPAFRGIDEGLQSGLVVTLETLFQTADVPKHLAVIGGGIAGLETAWVYARLGARVAVVEMTDEVGGSLDLDAARFARERMEEKGISFCLSVRHLMIGNGAVFTAGARGRQTIPADKVLMVMGRKPRISDLGIEKLGIYTKDGAVITDARMRTNVAGVWAGGDINGRSMLATTARREAAVAVADMNGWRDGMRYEMIPQVLFSATEAASVGETEISAGAKGIDYEVRQCVQRDFNLLADEELTGGFAKFLVDRGSGRLIGAHFAGAHAASAVYPATVFVGAKFSAASIRRMAFPFLSAGEVFQSARIGL